MEEVRSRGRICCSAALYSFSLSRACPRPARGRPRRRMSSLRQPSAGSGRVLVTSLAESDFGQGSGCQTLTMSGRVAGGHGTRFGRARAAHLHRRASRRSRRCAQSVLGRLLWRDVLRPAPLSLRQTVRWAVYCTLGTVCAHRRPPGPHASRQGTQCPRAGRYAVPSSPWQREVQGRGGASSHELRNRVTL